MSNVFQLKRTSVAGRTPNVSSSSNTSYIYPGELAVNLNDRKIFSSNGSALFEVGANLTSLSANTITVNSGTVSTTTSTGAVVISGGMGMTGSITIGGKIGVANSGGNIKASFTYNEATGSIDTVFE